MVGPDDTFLLGPEAYFQGLCHVSFGEGKNVLSLRVIVLEDTKIHQKSVGPVPMNLQMWQRFSGVFFWRSLIFLKIDPPELHGISRNKLGFALTGLRAVLAKEKTKTCARVRSTLAS